MNKQPQKEKMPPLKRLGIYAAGTMLAGLAVTEVVGIAYVYGQVHGAHQVASQEKQMASTLRSEGEAKEARGLVRHANTLETWAEDMTSPENVLATGIVMAGTLGTGGLLAQIRRRQESQEMALAN